MLVKCFPVPNERTPKKVEITLGRVSEHKKNTIRLNARIAKSQCEASEEAPVEAIVTKPATDDNLSGIIPVSELRKDEYVEVENAFEDFSVQSDNSESESVKADDLNDDLFLRELSATEINADFEALQNDLRKLENDLRSQLGDDEPEAVEDAMFSMHDEGIVRRHFVRDDSGDLYESDSADAEGHEVACYDNTGKLTRACGIIRKGQPLFKESDTDDIYSRVASDMFSDGNY